MITIAHVWRIFQYKICLSSHIFQIYIINHLHQRLSEKFQ